MGSGASKSEANHEAQPQEQPQSAAASNTAPVQTKKEPSAVSINSIATKEELRQTLKDIAVRVLGAYPNSVDSIASDIAALTVLSGITNLVSNQKVALFSMKEQTVIMLTISAINECELCTSTHAKVALESGLSKGDLENIVCNTVVVDPEYKHLVDATRAIYSQRGYVDPEQRKVWGEKGLTTAHLQEIVALISVKVAANFCNNLAQQPVDTNVMSFLEQQDFNVSEISKWKRADAAI